jgi:PAS domain S-box-containing protein
MRAAENTTTVPEAEETVRAIYQGSVDAIVVQGPTGPQIVTLTGADEPYRILVERMSDGAATVASDGTVLYVNERLAEMCGLPANLIVGQPFKALFQGDFPELFVRWAKPLDQGVRHQLTLQRKDGPSFPVSVWAGPIVMGNEPATLATVTDLSAQRRAEEIAVAERFARSILDQATDAIMVLDPSGTIVRASGPAEHLAGGPPVGQKFSEVFQLDASGPQRDRLAQFSTDILDRLLATRMFHGVEVSLQGRALKGRTFLLSAGPLLDDNKQSVGSIVTLTDITARKRAEEQQTVLVAELNHRVKNILAIVQSVAAQTVRNSVSLPAFQETFGGRLKALSTAHDILTRTRWTGVELTELLSQSLAPYRERIRMHGLPLLLPSQAVVPLSMALHELMTNAAKYGALSTSGHVELSWERIENVSATIRLTWAERGGPPIKGNGKQGFGTTLIERVVSYDLDGTASITFDPAGLRCTMHFPLEAERASVEALPASARALG